MSNIDTSTPVSEINYNGASIPVQASNGLPAGGTTDQILAKASDTDYDTKWVDASGGGTLYRHIICIKTSGNTPVGNTQIISKSNEIFTRASIIQFLKDNGYTSIATAYPLSGGYTDGSLKSPIGMIRSSDYGDTLVIKVVKTNCTITENDDETISATLTGGTITNLVITGNDYCTDIVTEI